MKLTDILEQLETAVENDDEATIIECLEALEGKIDNFSWVHKKLKIKLAAREAAYKSALAEVENIYGAGYRQVEAELKNLENYLLQLFEHGKLEEKNLGDESVLSFRNYPKVEINQPADTLPPEFQNVSYSANKKAIKSAIENGEDIGLIAELKDNYKVFFTFKKGV